MIETSGEERSHGWLPLRATGQKPMGVPDDSKRQVFLTPEGQEVTSQFDIGPASHHQQVFIEYERTFGRGKAKEETHKEGQSLIRTEYRALASFATYMMLASTNEEAVAYIERLATFRSNHPELYSDAAQPKKKFSISSIEG